MSVYIGGKMERESLTHCLKALQSGDMDAFPSFFEATKKSVFLSSYAILGKKEEAEDIVNETYLKFLRSLPTIDPKKNVMAYLTAISRNESLNALAKRQKVGELEEEDSRLLCYDDYLSEFSLFDRAKDVLPRDEFEILLMVMVDDLKHREIAKILHKPLGTVSFKYAKAIKTLRKELSHERL